MNWKARMKNKTFWASLIAAIVLLSQQLGLNIFPKNIADIVNTILLIATILGVIIDPSTDGIKDGQKEQIE
jgi:phi LC3 family holin